MSARYQRPGAASHRCGSLAIRGLPLEVRVPSTAQAFEAPAISGTGASMSAGAAPATTGAGARFSSREGRVCEARSQLVPLSGDTVEELQRCLEVLRPLQEMQAMLYAAEQLPVDAVLKQAARTLRRELRVLAEGARREILEIDVTPLGRRAEELLQQVSEAARSRWTGEA